MISDKRLAVLALVFVVVWTALGLYFGSTEPNASMGFGAVLWQFGQDTKTKTIFTAILVDLVTGIAAALRLRVFDMQRVAGFYVSNVFPYLFCYCLYWTLILLGLDNAVAPMLQETLVGLGFGMIMTALTGSVIDNAQRIRAPISSTDVKHGVASPPYDALG